MLSQSPIEIYPTTFYQPKVKITAKFVKISYPKIIRIEYCNLQSLLKPFYPSYYTAGVYGWNADIYTLSTNIAICTGYRPFGNVRPTWETISKYEKLAQNTNSPDELVAIEKHQLLTEFVTEVLRNAKAV